MNVKVINGSITFGELYENGGFVGQYEIPTTQVDTEQKVLAWVYHLCEKSWIDIGDIKSFKIYLGLIDYYSIKNYLS